MTLIYLNYISRRIVQDYSKTLFVFGDNFLQKGLGGQAKEMRGESNAVGIPTKRYPAMSLGSFLSDNDVKEWVRASNSGIIRLRQHQGQIIWPKQGIGTGLAQLQKRAPMIWDAIELLRKELEQRP